MHEHPVRLVIRDDLHRSRLTVFFRVALSIPHLFWLVLWTAAAWTLWIVAWLLALITGKLPMWLHRFFCAYIRYRAHLTAFLTIVANPFPGFVGAPGSYPIDVELPERLPQSRWRTLFRPVLAIWTLSFWATSWVIGAFAWVVSLFTGRTRRGLRDLGAMGVAYRAQVRAYVMFVTDAYPTADPATVLAGLEPPPLHPVRIAKDDDDLQRSRVLVFFRLAVLIPHVVWLAIWTVAALLLWIVQWIIMLFTGRPNAKLHAFHSRWLRQVFHVTVFATLCANPFPGFNGEAGSYPVDLELPPPAPQSRWKTLFRMLLAYPASGISAVVGGIMQLAVVLSWFVGVALGRSPKGLRNFSLYAARYSAQVNAYVFLITDVYPHSSPLEGASEAPVAPAVEEPVAPADEDPAPVAT